MCKRLLVYSFWLALLAGMFQTIPSSQCRFHSFLSCSLSYFLSLSLFSVLAHLLDSSSSSSSSSKLVPFMLKYSCVCCEHVFVFCSLVSFWICFAVEALCGSAEPKRLISHLSQGPKGQQANKTSKNISINHRIVKNHKSQC